MAGYVRQSTADIIPTATVRAAPINAEYNALRDAFAASGGHKHDGTSGEGEYVPLIADLDALNKVVIDTTNNRVGVFVEVSAAAVEQIRIQDGVIVPVTDNDIDLGTSSLEFKDLYLDGTAYIDTLAVHESATITSNFSVNGNTTLGNAASDTVTFTADIASAMLPSADNTHDLGAVGSEWRNLYIDGTANIDALIADTATISAGTIDNTVIGGSTAVAGSFSTISSSGATTLASLTVSGATALNGGLTLDTNKFTVADTTGNTAIAGTLDVTGATTVADFTATGTTVLPATSFGDNNITNVGNIALDSITADGSSITITGNTTFADGAYDFDVASHDGSNGLKLAGTLVTSSAAELNKLDGATVTTTEINILDGDTSATSTTVADADRVVMNDNGTMVQVAVTDLAAYFDDEITAMPNLVTTAATTVGALNSGSITSGFGSIDTGSSTITTTGNITGGNVIISDGGNIGSASDTDAIAIASNGNVTLSQNLTVSGDLQVDGTTTTVNSNNLSVDDQLIELGNGRTGSATGDSGIVIERGSDANAFIGFDESADKFTVGTGTFTGTSTGDLSITTGTLVANIEGNVTGDLTGNADTATALETARTIAGQSFDGTANISIATTDLTGVTATAAEVNIMDGDTAATSTTLADADRVVVNDAGTMKQVALTDFETYFESALDTLSNVTTVGTLNSGSITSGFGSIDNGSSAITTTGTITFGTLSDGSDSVTDIVTSVGSGSANSELPTALAVENRIQAINSISNNVSGLNATGAELNAVADVSAITIDTSTAIANNDGIAVFDSSASSIGYFDVDLLDTYFAGTTKTLTNKTLTSPTVSGLYLSDAGFIVEGSSADGNEATVTFTNPTADRTITFPDATGTVALSGATQNVDFGTVTADGLTVDGDAVFTTGDTIRLNTSDGSDNGVLAVAGGGANSDGRGARARLYGNEHASKGGDVDISTGNVSGAQMDLTAAGVININSGGSSAIHIDASQKVIIGDTSTRGTYGLTVAEPSDGVRIFGIASGGVDALHFDQARGSVASPTASNADGDGSYISFSSYDGTNFDDIGSLAVVTDSAQDAGRMIFRTTPTGGSQTERMRITSGGSVLIGKQSVSLATAGTEISSSGYVAASIAGDVAGYFNRNTDDGEVINIYRSGSTKVGYLGTNSASGTPILEIASNTSSGILRFMTSGSEAMRIDSSQNVLIGYPDTFQVAGHNGAVQVVGQGTADYHGATTSIVGFSNNSNGAYLNFGSGRSNTAGTYTVVANNDTVGQINFAAADGTDMNSRAAHITTQIDGAPGSNDTPGRIMFFTSSDGSASPTERMRIDSSGRVAIQQKLSVGGPITATSPDASFTVQNSGADVGKITAVFGADANLNTLSNNFDKEARVGIPHYDTSEEPASLFYASASSSVNHLTIGGGTSRMNSMTSIRFRTAANTTTATGTEAMRIDSSQRVLIGTGTARADLFNTTATAALQVEGTTGNTSAASIVRNSNDDNGPQFILGKSNGTSVGSDTVVTDDALLGRISYQGADGSELVEGARIESQVDGTPGANDMPGRLQFYTTADGASSPTERMRITSDAKVGINKTDLAYTLEVQTSGTNNGDMRVGGSSGNTATGLSFDYSNSGTTAATIKNNYATSSGSALLTIGSGKTDFKTGTSESLRMRIDDGGELLIGGQTTARNNFASTTSGGFKVGVEGTNADNTKIASVRNVNGVNGPYLVLGHTRASAVNGVTVLAEDDHLGTLSFQGADGTGLREGANIRAEVDGALSGGGAADMPGRLIFSTTADGAASPTERMRINNAGTVIINPNLTGGYIPLIVKGERSSGTTLLNLETDGTGQNNDAIQIDFKMNSGADATERVAGRIAVQNVTTGAARGRMIFSVLEDAGNLKEAMRIDDDGEVLIGSTQQANSVPPLNLKGAAGGVSGNNFVAGKHGDSNYQPAYTTVRSRGSEASPTSVAENDGIAAYNSYGYDGNSYIYTGGIQMYVDGTPGTNDMPSRMSFYTVSDGSNSATERMRIDSTGRVMISGAAGNLNAPTSLMGDMNAYLRVGNSGAQIGTLIKYSHGPNTNVNGAVFQLRTGSNGQAAYLRITCTNYQGARESIFFANNASGNWNVTEVNVADYGGNSPNFAVTTGTTNPTVTVSLPNTSYSGGFLDVSASNNWQLTLA